MSRPQFFAGEYPNPYLPAIPLMDGVAPHCGACAHGCDGGIPGTAVTCSIDGQDRLPSRDDCAHPAQFLDDPRPIAEKYPLHDPAMYVG